MKIGIIVQRYGREVVGGAELHCRWVAEELARRHEVEIITTTAIEYLTWENDYAEGMDEVDGIPVRRFPVPRRRRNESFEALSNKVCFFRHTDAEERRWMDEHGPYVPELITWLQANHSRYDRLIFFCYRYYTSYYGLQVAPEKSILVPTAEHDRAIYMRLFTPFFRLPAAIAFNSVEERELIQRVTGNTKVPGEVVGVGIRIPAGIDIHATRRRLDLFGEYVLYIGRVEREKGCLELIDYFLRYRNRHNRMLRLILAGKSTLEIVENVHIRPVGVVTETDKFGALAGSAALLMPSRYESLSMVLLEAWAMGRPALVNGCCEVLRGQILRSNGGLYYHTYEEFEEALNLLLMQPQLALALGEQGRGYFEKEYSWPAIADKYERLFSLAGTAGAAGSRW